MQNAIPIYKQWQQKFDQIYLNVSSWQQMKVKLKKIKSQPNTDQFLQRILDTEYYYQKNNPLSKQFAKDGIFTTIYEKGLSEDLKNNSAVRSVQFVAQNIILDVQSPSQFDYYYKPRQNEYFKYPSLMFQKPQNLMQNELIMELLMNEGSVITINQFDPQYSDRRDFYMLVSLAFFIKFIILIYE